MALKIVDISAHQGSGINWPEVKKAVDGVLIRIGVRGYYYNRIVYDTEAISNIKGAEAAGIPWGVYFFSQRTTASEGKEEALWTIERLKGLAEENIRPTLPIYIDSELSGASGNIGRADHLDRATRTSVVKAFCETMEENGYYVGIYASLSWFKGNLDDSQLTGFDHWIAYWKDVEAVPYQGDVGIWQYTNSGSVSGIGTRVDLNRAYKNYPELIKENGLNGWPKQETEKLAPISDHRIQLQIGPASSGDRHTFRRLLEGLAIEYQDDGQNVITGLVSKGDQLTILKRAKELQVEVIEYINDKPAEGDSDIIGREEGGNASECPQTSVDMPNQQESEKDDKVPYEDENATEGNSEASEAIQAESFLIRLLKAIIRWLKGEKK